MVRIDEVLNLERFNSFRLVAGSKGLDKMVSRAGFIDHESIEDLKKDDIRNEMILSSLPMIKGHPSKIVDYIQALIEAETACFALKTTLFKEIPQEAINLANKYNYPLFLFSDTFVDKLILDIDKLLDEQYRLAKTIELINKMENDRLRHKEIRRYSLELNKNFCDQIIVAVIRETKTSTNRFDYKSSKKRIGKSSLIIPIENTYMIIFSSDLDRIDKNVIVQKLGLNPGNYHIGVSSSSNDHGKLGQLIYESKISFKYSCYKDLFLSSYSDLGIYQILIPTLEQGNSNSFYEEIIEKIMEYDDIYKSDLLKTTIAYVNSDGNIKETAKKLFQHPNTVRFRIRKVKEIINFDEFVGAKYETMALAIHLYELNESRKKSLGL